MPISANPQMITLDPGSSNSIQPVEVSNVDGYDTGHPLQDWFHRVSDGWNNFWSNLGDNAVSYYDQSQVGNQAVSNMMNPENMESMTNLAAGVGPSPLTNDFDGNSIDQALEGSPSLSQYIQDNPNMSAEDYLKYMSEHSDEWAEKYIDYQLEHQSINEQNEYVANREDTAYQRLVQDLKAAGLNPAMMYGSSASVQGGSSAGVVKASEGANARTIGNYEKIKNLLLAYMIATLKAGSTFTNAVGTGLQTIFKML